MCSVISATRPPPVVNNDVLCHTIVVHCYLYTPPSTLHPKSLLDSCVSQIAFDSTASTNCSFWKPRDVWVGYERERCLVMFFLFWLHHSPQNGPINRLWIFYENNNKWSCKRLTTNKENHSFRKHSFTVLSRDWIALAEALFDLCVSAIYWMMC